ncbi:cation:proton antiporter [Nocardia sp. NPDC056000]|uniref:cation:proton antiporter n=1 Tax=Nocardia sp. NPDC056000 TaxID=3345674 RepID=UPI0035DD0E8E
MKEALVLLDLAIIVALARLLGAAAQRLRQPPVVGEILAGFMLGPSLLGLLPGQLDTVLFPADVRELLSIIAQVGLVLFMFGIGFELDMERIRGHRGRLAAIAAGSVLVPFTVGAGVMALLYSRHDTIAGHRVDPWALSIFVGAAMAITAFPVLARILADNGMRHGRIGTLALACAAVEDVVAWLLLVVAVSIAHASGIGGFVVMLARTVVFGITLLYIVRPGLRWLFARLSPLPGTETTVFTITVAGLFLSAWATAAIGLHPVFGAFLFGAVVPREQLRRIAPTVPDRIAEPATLLLPVFFVVAGLSVKLNGLGWAGFGELVLLLLVACLTKFAGATAPALATGMPMRSALTMGVLVNARGLTELVILSVGLQLQVIDQQIYTCLAVMALVTTAMTEPLTRLLYRRGAAAVEEFAPSGRVSVPG